MQIFSSICPPARWSAVGWNLGDQSRPRAAGSGAHADPLIGRAQDDSLPDFYELVVYSSCSDQARVVGEACELCRAGELIVQHLLWATVRRVDSQGRTTEEQLLLRTP